MARFNMQHSKYGNHKVWCNGRKFDSQHEADRYFQLCILEKSGIISDLQCQKAFTLIPTQKRIDVTERAVKYIADFVYRENGELVVEDAKGFKTPEYIIKRKLMLYIHGIRVREV